MILSNIKSFSSILLAAIAFSGCKPSGTTETEPVVENRSEQEAPETSHFPDEQAQKIIKDYLTIKDALVRTNGEEAKSAAAGLSSKITAEDDDLLSKIKSSAGEIASTSDVEQQRKHFYTLSEHVYSLIKNTEDNEQTLYRQYCPMAMNNEGAFWISSEEEIRNPYFGDRMLKCGHVKETLN